jgi:hypothetical protein
MSHLRRKVLQFNSDLVGLEVTGKQKILEIARSMVRYNHPVSTDWLIGAVFEVGKQRLVGWLQKSFPEDPFELFARKRLVDDRGGEERPV